MTVIPLAGEKATDKAWLFGGACGVAVLVATASSGAPAWPSVRRFHGSPVGDLAGTASYRALISPEQEAQLNSTHACCGKLDLEAARRALSDLEHRRDVRDRLTALRAKMVKIGLELYLPRIAALDGALATIDRQMELETRLRDGYEKSIQMLEIEIEAGAAADALDTAATLHIAETLAEMRELETEQAELGRQRPRTSSRKPCGISEAEGRVTGSVWPPAAEPRTGALPFGYACAKASARRLAGSQRSNVECRHSRLRASQRGPTPPAGQANCRSRGRCGRRPADRRRAGR
jgi:hypothetical protein